MSEYFDIDVPNINLNKPMNLPEAQAKYKLTLRQTSCNVMMRHNIELAHRALTALDDGWDVFALPIDPPPTEEPGLGSIIYKNAKLIGSDGVMTQEIATVFFDDRMAGWSFRPSE